MASKPPARPSDELLARLYEGKCALHAAQRALPYSEKIRQLLELQKIHYEIMRSRGLALRPWEKPWDIEL